jgi:hypothetical protein
VRKAPDLSRDLVVSRYYKPFPRQREFHRSPAKYRLFGGAAGPGKTKALLWEAIRQANRYPNVDTLLLRRTFAELESSLLAYFRRDVPRELYKSFNDTKKVITWHNGSTTRFGYCQNENDVFQYQGAEFLFIGIDELTLFTLKQWQFLTSRNRCPHANALANMAAASNPGNIGHAWVKALWIDRRSAPGMESSEQYDPDDYAFIRATVQDNPIYANDANYLKTLNALPRHLRQAFLEGDWTIFAGQYFDIFDQARHTARPEELEIEAWWPRWISIDWGFQHPSAVYWHAAAPDGCTITYREFVQSQLSPRMLAQAIAERSVDSSGRRERIEAAFLSPDAFAERTSDASIAEQLSEIFVRNALPAPSPADNDRVGGWMLMYQQLEAGRWIIAENCAELIRVLPTLTRSGANVEDILKVDGDDPADAARYGLMSRLRPAGAPFAERLSERVTSTDPTVRAIQIQRALTEQRKFARSVALPRRCF